MIYTLTLNPAVDYLMGVDTLTLGVTNRTTRDNVWIGGKGLDVSIVLHRMGLENVALGFVGGFTGDYVISVMDEEQVKHEFIRVEGLTRINVKLQTSTEESQINAQGPRINRAELVELVEKISTLTSEDVFIMSGSIPPGVSKDFYTRIAGLLASRNVPFILDTTEKELVESLKYRPFLIKPNKEEIEDITGVKITSMEQAVVAAHQLREMGARNVIVSLGNEGAILAAHDGKIYCATAAKGQLVDSVGAGDSMIAGFVYKFNESGNLSEALAYGSAAGGATAFSPTLCTKDEVEALYPTIQVTVVS